MNKHPHEEVILAYYRGEKIEFRPDSSSEWKKTFSYDYGARTPSFRHDHQYRIKPQPPKTHTIELTQEEVEALLCLTARVGGQCENTARRHAESANAKLEKLIPEQRRDRLYRWRTKQDMVDGEIGFRGDLPA